MERSTGRFEVVERKIGSGRCVMLDGGTATELSRPSVNRSADERLWGTDALVSSPDYVLSVHRRYVEVGCDVISTNTWGLPNALRDSSELWEAMGPVHWMDVARRGIGLARQAHPMPSAPTSAP
jgi:S-methylmethionine-dependent homocysteine/selenocysteine methylase